MFPFNELVHQAEDIMKENLLLWFRTNQQDADVYASRYTNLLDTGEMAITHLFPMNLSKLPYVIVDIAGFAETTLGFGWNSLDPTSLLKLTLTGPIFNVTDKEIIIKQLSNSKIISIDFPSVLFTDAVNVSISDLVQVIQSQMPSSWYIETDDDNVYINIRNSNVTVIQGAFGLSAGDYEADVIQHKHIGLNATLGFDIGTQNEKTRKDLLSLIFTYIEKLRENQGIVGNDYITIVINSPFKQGNETQAPISMNDTLNQLYVTSVMGGVYLDIVDIKGRIMEAVTAVDTLNDNTGGVIK